MNDTIQLSGNMSMYEHWASYQTQTLGFAMGGTVHPQNAHLFIKRFVEASHDYQVAFINNPLHRKELRIALRYWEDPLVKPKDLYPLTIDGQNIYREVCGIPIVIEVKPHGIGYVIHSDAITLSFYIRKGKDANGNPVGVVPGFTNEKLRAFALINLLCRELGYAYL